MSYIEAKAKYAQYGIDTEKAIETLKNVCVSVHCCFGGRTWFLPEGQKLGSHEPLASQNLKSCI